jgi:hypothetical protein
MSIEQVTSGNLRRTQAFDKELRSLANIDAIADEMADAILFERNPGKRKGKIGTLVDRLVKETETRVFPQAEKIGRQNAVDILSKTPDPVDLNDPTQRAAALFQGRQRYTTRLNMVRDAVSANGNTLDSALTRYWLEPSEGDAKGKVERLRQIHNTLEKKRKAWETDMRRFSDGEIKTRPTEPRLDFLSEMTAQSKKDIRVQARRAGTDAEIAMFSAKGYAKFIWVTPNGAAACPDCRNRQSVILTVVEWERIGRPGSGRTVCGAHCFCMLVPAEAVSRSSALLTGKHTRDAGPLTSPDDLAILNANRATTVKQAERKAAQVGDAAASAAARRAVADGAAKAKAAARENVFDDPSTTVHTPVSDAFRNEVIDAHNTLPKALRDQMRARGTRVHASQYFTDAHPNLKGVTPRGWPPGETWDGAEGANEGRDVYISERVRFAGEDKRSNRIGGVYRHEYGHNVSANLDHSGVPLELRKEFADAHARDVAALTAKQKKEWPHTFMLQPNGGGESEAFAEGFAHIYGGGSTGNGFDFGKHYPNTVDAIKTILQGFGV